MTFAYIRVSTDRQTLDNQRYEIKCFCEKNRLRIDCWIHESVSGTKAAAERKLGMLLQKLHKDDLLICAELSRLGRNMFMVMTILHTCMEKGCRVWTIKEGYKLGDDLQSKVPAFAFGMAADIERNLISSRTREALARKKAEGKQLGRVRGCRNKIYKLDAKEGYIIKMLERHVSKSEIARACGVSRNTLNRWIEKHHHLI